MGTGYKLGYNELVWMGRLEYKVKNLREDIMIENEQVFETIASKKPAVFCL